MAKSMQAVQLYLPKIIYFCQNWTIVVEHIFMVKIFFTTFYNAVVLLDVNLNKIVF